MVYAFCSIFETRLYDKRYLKCCHTYAFRSNHFLLCFVFICFCFVCVCLCFAALPRPTVSSIWPQHARYTGVRTLNLFRSLCAHHWNRYAKQVPAHRIPLNARLLSMFFASNACKCCGHMCHLDMAIAIAQPMKLEQQANCIRVIIMTYTMVIKPLVYKYLIYPLRVVSSTQSFVDVMHMTELKPTAGSGVYVCVRARCAAGIHSPNGIEMKSIFPCKCDAQHDVYTMYFALATTALPPSFPPFFNHHEWS